MDKGVWVVLIIAGALTIAAVIAIIKTPPIPPDDE